MVASISDQLMPLVPQLQDYLCTICNNIASYPMKSGCGHITCSRCINKMLRKNMVCCPICRADITAKKNARKYFFLPQLVLLPGLNLVTTTWLRTANVDWVLEKVHWKYFPKETKEKHAMDRLELGRELHGDSYNPSDCNVM